MNNVTRKNILLVEDDSGIRESLEEILVQEGYKVESAANGQAALDLIKLNEGKYDVILSDIQMPLADGHTILRTLKETNNDTPIILMTAFGTIQMGVDAIKNGAHDFITKPIEIDDLKNTIEKALVYSQLVLSKETSEQSDSAESKSSQTHLIGESPSMKKIFALISRIARVDSTVLILGESGTGKEVIAKEIHRKSNRRDKKFIAINCAAIPHDLLESELFGHAKGSFTGATIQKKGLFEEAEGGTLFLDEIGDMAPTLQAKLLRVLQDRKIRAVGSNVARSLDVRIIAATHKDLRLAIVEGEFREDLFYRLSVIPVFIAPLRERKEDIRPLAIHFAKRASGVVQEGYKTFSEEALVKLQNFQWHGNVRELENVIERCLVMCPRNVIKATDLDFLDTNEVISQDASSEGGTQGQAQSETFCLKEIEKETLILALKKTEGKKAEAAKLLGIDRKTLHRKEQEYGLV
jgi:DNA-binding NtrC family response regulator